MCDYNLIIDGLQEVVGNELLKELASARVVRVYWGTAPTGRIHLGYFLPMLKIAQLLKANCGVTILIADLHAMLDNLKSTESQVEQRSRYYMHAIQTMLKTTFQVDLRRIHFVKGTEFQLSPKYTMDMYRINTLCRLNDAKHAGADVVKQTDNPLMTGLLYPTLQALDEEYLQADAQLGGVDQRKIFMFAREYLPKLKYKKRIHLMTPMIPALRCEQQHAEPTKDQPIPTEDQPSPTEDQPEITNKMSASNNKTKIDILDSKKTIKKKVNSAFCFPGNIHDNSVLDILEKLLFPILNFKEEKFTINRKEEHGGPLTYSTYQEVENDFEKEQLHPADLKLGVSDLINDFFSPIRQEFDTSEWKKLLTFAYPDN